MDESKVNSLPSGITREQIEDTRSVFQPRYKEPLTDDDCIEMIQNMYALFDLLEEIDGKSKSPATASEGQSGR